jgi:hypothetical protein
VGTPRGGMASLVYWSMLTFPAVLVDTLSPSLRRGEYVVIVGVVGCACF